MKTRDCTYGVDPARLARAQSIQRLHTRQHQHNRDLAWAGCIVMSASALFTITAIVTIIYLLLR